MSDLTWFAFWVTAIILVPWALTELTSRIVFRMPWSWEPDDA